MKVAVYCRVSSTGQEDNTSLDNQEEKGVLFCESRGYVPVVFRDSSTGANVDREAFTSMWHMMEKKEVVGVWIWRTDRLLRDLGIYNDFVIHVERTKCKLWIDGSEVDVSDVAGFSRMAYESVGATVEKMSIALRTSEGKRRKLESGTMWSGRVPLGFKRKKNVGIVIDEETTGLVKEVFRVFVLKSTSKYEDVFNHLIKYNKNLPKSVNQTTIPRILRNTIYIGEKVFDTKFGRYTYNVEPTISNDLWVKSQQKMRDVKKYRGRRTRIYELEGLVKCGSCGRPLWISGQRQRGIDYRYYSCHQHNPKSRFDKRFVDYDNDCSSIMNNKISVSKLENVVWEVLFNILEDVNTIESDYKKQFNDHATIKNKFKGKKVYYEKQLEKVESRLDSLAINLADGVIDKGRYKRALILANKEIDKVKEKLSSVLSEYNKYDTKVNIKDYFSLMKEDLKRKRNIQRKEDRKVILQKYVNSVSVKLLSVDSKVSKSYNIVVDLHLESNSSSYVLSIDNIDYKVEVSKSDNRPKVVTYNHRTLVYHLFSPKLLKINNL